jgi:manganese-dependent inorganic pyrophosphatase
LNRGGSDVLMAGERKDIFVQAFPQSAPDGPVYLPGVLSRKKQVVPLIMAAESNR